MSGRENIEYIQVTLSKGMIAGPSRKSLKHLSCLVDPLGYPKEAPHLFEDSAAGGIQAAHGTKTVQAQEVDACPGLAGDGTGSLWRLWPMCSQTLLHPCKPGHLPRGLRVMF